MGLMALALAAEVMRCVEQRKQRGGLLFDAGAHIGVGAVVKQGIHIGRPRVTDRRGFNARYKTILERLERGDISRRKAAKELGIGYATLKRLLENKQAPDNDGRPE